MSESGLVPVLITGMVKSFPNPGPKNKTADVLISVLDQNREQKKIPSLGAQIEE